MLDAPRAPVSEKQRKEQQEHYDRLLRFCLLGVNEVYLPNLRAGANVEVKKQKAVDECLRVHRRDQPYWQLPYVNRLESAHSDL